MACRHPTRCRPPEAAALVEYGPPPKASGHIGVYFYIFSKKEIFSDPLATRFAEPVLGAAVSVSDARP